MNRREALLERLLKTTPGSPEEVAYLRLLSSTPDWPVADDGFRYVPSPDDAEAVDRVAQALCRRGVVWLVAAHDPQPMARTPLRDLSLQSAAGLREVARAVLRELRGDEGA